MVQNITTDDNGFNVPVTPVMPTVAGDETGLDIRGAAVIFSISEFSNDLFRNME